MPQETLDENTDLAALQKELEHPATPATARRSILTRIGRSRLSRFEPLVLGFISRHLEAVSHGGKYNENLLDSALKAVGLVGTPTAARHLEEWTKLGVFRGNNVRALHNALSALASRLVVADQPRALTPTKPNNNASAEALSEITTTQKTVATASEAGKRKLVRHRGTGWVVSLFYWFRESEVRDTKVKEAKTTIAGSGFTLRLGVVITASLVGLSVLWKQIDERETEPPQFDKSAFAVSQLTTEIDLTSWVPVSPEQMRGKIKVSQSKEHTIWKLRKTQVTAHTFRVTIYTPGLAPDIVPDPRHRLLWSGEVPYEAPPGTDRFPRYDYYFDVSNEVVGEEFTLDYRMIRWNTHQGKPHWWHGKVIDFPTEELVYRLSFPSWRPSLSRDLWLKDYENNKEVLLTEGVDYVASHDGNSVTFSIKRPKYHFGYIYHFAWSD